ncbi:MAG: hypothetical protein WC414_00820 [Patescibacteria group bacterium]
MNKKRKILFLSIIILPFFLNGCVLDLFSSKNNQKTGENLFANENENLNTSTSTQDKTVKEKEKTNNLFKTTTLSCHTCEFCSGGFQKQVETFSSDQTMIACIDCNFNNDCQEGYTCNNNICVNKNILNLKPSCKIDDNGLGNCQDIDCLGCATGHPKCKNDFDTEKAGKCIECNDDYDCEYNYVCRDFTCLKINSENITKTDKNTSTEKILISEIPYYDGTKQDIQEQNSNNSNISSQSNSTQNNSNQIYETYICGRIDCFADKFAGCNTNIVFEQTKDLSTTRYEIIGRENGKCRIKMTYLKYPKNELENKEMICLFDNKKTFTEAENEVINNIKTADCKGELADILKMFN